MLGCSIVFYLFVCFLLGNFVSAKYNLSRAYIPSFQKKEVGSVGQRIQLAPLAGQLTSKSSDSCLPDDQTGQTHTLTCSTVLCRNICEQDCVFNISPLCPLFLLLASLSPPDNKDKLKSDMAKPKPISNSSLSESNEGISYLCPESALPFTLFFLPSLAYLCIFLMLLFVLQ